MFTLVSDAFEVTVGGVCDADRSVTELCGYNIIDSVVIYAAECSYPFKVAFGVAETYKSIFSTTVKCEISVG